MTRRRVLVVVWVVAAVVTMTPGIAAAEPFGGGCAAVGAQLPGGRLHTMTPVRILDGRTGQGWVGPLGAGQTRDLVVGGQNGVPAGATAALANVAVTGPTLPSALTVFEEGTARPSEPSFAFLGGATVMKLVPVALSATGRVSFYNAVGTVNVIVDLYGYYDAVPGDLCDDIAPTVVFDTVAGVGSPVSPLAPGETRSFAVAAVGPIPVNATAVAVVFEALDQTATSDYARLYPDGAPVPNTTQLVSGPAFGMANHAVVPIGTNGKVAVSHAVGLTNVRVTVLGWFGGSGSAGPGGSFTLTPSYGGVGTTVTADATPLNGTFSSYTWNWGDGTTSTGATASHAYPTAGYYRVHLDAVDGGAIVRTGDRYVAISSGEPFPPTNVAATPANRAAQVSWVAPVLDGGAFITAYSVVASPGGAGCATTGGERSCIVPGLANGTAYTFRVVAWNPRGPSGFSDPSAPVTPSNTIGARFHPMAPVRILDSRTAIGGWVGAPLGEGQSKDLTVAGINGVAPSASAIVVNVTVTQASKNSFLTVRPTGSTLPLASNLNFAAGETIANLVTVGVGTGGRVSLFNQLGDVHVVVDAVGWFDEGLSPGDLLNPLDPARILDSRTNNGGWNAKLAAGAANARTLLVRGRGGVALGATAAVLNVTVTEADAGSFLEVWPTGAPRPTASTLNFGPGDTIANLVMVPLGPTGEVSVFNQAGNVHVVVDVVGYFHATTGDRFHATAPTRLLDDRNGTGLSGPWGPATTRGLVVAGVGAVAPDATAVLANLTATNASAGSFVTSYPNGVARPNSSNLNFRPGQTIPNLTLTRIGTGGQIALYNEAGTVDLVSDVAGYFAST